MAEAFVACTSCGSEALVVIPDGAPVTPEVVARVTAECPACAFVVAQGAWMGY